jgi:hypothetical protein
MNKEERKLKGKFKYLKRLHNYGLTKSNVLRNTGKPCSCWMCSPAKSGEIRPSVIRKLQKVKSLEKEY